jgi:hypothetical protein
MVRMNSHKLAQRRVFALLLGIAAGVSPSHAQQAATTDNPFERGNRLRAYASSPARVAALTKLALYDDEVIHRKRACADDDTRFELLNVIDYGVRNWAADQANPTVGQWVVRYAITMCEKTLVYNANYTASPQGLEPRLQPYFPGSTLASSRLQDDAYRVGAPLALALNNDRDCHRALVSDVRVDEQPHRLVEGTVTFERAWTETWSFDTCGRQVDLTAKFTSASDGGTDFHFSRAK